MSQKYIVTAVDRSAQGHPNYHTPGRAWPSGQPVEVEVLDQDADPMLEKVVDGVKRQYPDPVRIGRKAWQRICSDSKLTVRAAGDNVQDVQVLASKLAEAEQATRAAEARAAASEARVATIEREGPERSQKAQQEIVRLQGVADKRAAEVDEANAKLRIANERAESAEAAAGRLTAERDELQAQLEQLTAPPAQSKGKGNKGKAGG